MQHSIFTSFLRDLETHEKGNERSELQNYHVECWETCRATYVALKKLEIAEHCISTSYTKVPNEQEIAEHIEYHIENYLIRSRTVYDRVLQFVNCLCDIQMSKEYVNHNSIITNGKVVSCGFVNKLKKIKKACAVYQTDRNVIIHQDKLKDDELEWVDTALKAKHMLDGDLEKIGIKEETVINNIAIIVSKKCREFRTNTKKIYDSVETFIDDAKVAYDKKSAKT